MPQTAVAAIVGIAQPDVSNLIRGRFRGYSIDRLMSFLVALDQDVEIVVKTNIRDDDPRYEITALTLGGSEEFLIMNGLNLQ